MTWLRRYRWPLGIALVAGAVRVVWNLYIHPPADFIYSDMLAYVGRATRLADDPGGGPWSDEVFYPWGAHHLLAAVIACCGEPQSRAVAAVWGLINAAIAPVTYFLAGRLHGGAGWSARAHGGAPACRGGSGRGTSSRTRELASATEPARQEDSSSNSVARSAGGLVCFYYPLVAYGGYFLSESPFALFVTLAALFALRLADHGRLRDALLFGAVAACGVAVRTQLLAAVAALLLFAVWRRRALPALSWRLLPGVLLPIALVLGYSSWLAERHHDPRRGLPRDLSPMPQNNALNRAFGRCHAYEISARDAMFGPPAFGELHRAEERDPDVLLKLAPALSAKLHVDGFIADQGKLHELADRCVAASGPTRQAYYAASHVALLWGFHTAWPDMGAPGFRRHMRAWTRGHLLAVALPALVGMAMGASARAARQGVLAMFLWSLLLTSMLYMGEARLRVPYDAVSIALAFDVYARAAVLLKGWWQARRSV